MSQTAASETASNEDSKSASDQPTPETLNPAGIASTSQPASSIDEASTRGAFSGEAVTSAEANLAQLDHDLESLERLELSGEAEQPQDEQSPWPADFQLSVVIPVYNEEATIEIVIDRIRALKVPKEVVIVDDCSTDGTRFILERFEKEPNFHIIYSPTNRGKGAALRAGFAQAAGDVVVVQDADLEYDPKDIPGLLGPIIEDEADVVYGSRFLGDGTRDQSWIHRLGNGILTWGSNRTTGLKLTDMETCYKAFRREAIRSVRLEQDRFGFEPEVTAKLARRGFRFAEAPIDYDARGYDEGKKIGIRDLFNAIYCIWRYGHQE